MPGAWKQHQSILTFCYLVAQNGVRSWDILITVLRRSTNWATRQLGNVSKIHTLIAKHWAREYREKTTPLRIFMPCYLSSCRVVMNLNSTQHSIVNHTAVTILFLISTHRLFNLLCIITAKEVIKHHPLLVQYMWNYWIRHALDLYTQMNLPYQIPID